MYTILQFYIFCLLFSGGKCQVGPFKHAYPLLRLSYVPLGEIVLCPQSLYVSVCLVLFTGFGSGEVMGRVGCLYVLVSGSHFLICI